VRAAPRGARERIDIDRFGADSTVSALVEPGVGVAFQIGRRVALTGEIDWRAVPPLSERPDWWRIAAGVGLAVR